MHANQENGTKEKTTASTEDTSTAHENQRGVFASSCQVSHFYLIYENRDSSRVLICRPFHLMIAWQMSRPAIRSGASIVDRALGAGMGSEPLF